MINHCYRDVKVRVLSLGPRLLGKALGVLPLYPAITSHQEPLPAFPLPTVPQPSVLSSRSSGQESLRDSTHSIPVHSISHSDSFILHSYSHVIESSNDGEAIAEDSCSTIIGVLPTPVAELTAHHANDISYNTLDNKEAKQITTALRDPGEPQTTESNELVVPVIREVGCLNKFVLSILSLLGVTTGLLFVLLLFLLIIIESDLDVALLHDIRQTPEFEQFHYGYFCPLRRWFACKLHWMGGLLINK
ncbi:FERM domain-containing protein 5 [Tachysurus ichikawai]